MTPSPTALPQVHLSAGQLLVTREPQVIATVLGSCVAVTMFERRSGLAAICHAMLARQRPGECLRPGDPGRFRYVCHALQAMIAAFRRSGIPPRDVEAKLFGGGNVIGRGTEAAGGCWFGEESIVTARELLAEAGVPLAAENTGGGRGRKILFNTATGEVLHKHLGQGHR